MVASSNLSLFPIDPTKREAGERGKTDCMFSSSRSRDFLPRFSGGLFPGEAEEANGSDSDEIELGLSLGGCFNSNSRKNRILRTSSIPAIFSGEVLPLFPLFRTCSLPEEEMQSAVRKEAKRKRENGEGTKVSKLRRFEVKNGVSSPAMAGWIAGAFRGSAASEGSNSSGGSEMEGRTGQGMKEM